MGVAEGKWKSRALILRSRGEGWGGNKSKASECCEQEKDLRMTAGIQVLDG